MIKIPATFPPTFDIKDKMAQVILRISYIIWFEPSEISEILFTRFLPGFHIVSPGSGMVHDGSPLRSPSGWIYSKSLGHVNAP